LIVVKASHAPRHGWELKQINVTVGKKKVQAVIKI
jgi:hypothetical protein